MEKKFVVLTKNLTPKVKEKLKEIEKEVVSLNDPLLFFLSKQATNDGFPLENNYGETHAIAAFSLLNKHLESIPPLVEGYMKKEKTHIDTHWEFNNAALQQVNKKHYPKIKETYYPLYYNMFFFRKVTNWMLLRNIAYLRDENVYSKLKGNMITILVLLFQQWKGKLYDERFTRPRNKSHQYQAFATSLLGEIALETKNPFYMYRFKEASRYLRSISKDPEKFNDFGSGRGARQIFGYSSAIHALVLYGMLEGDIQCLDQALELVKYFKTFQRKDGSLPLVLTKEELNIKKYEEKLYPHWESYNRLYDYLGFSALYLAKTQRLIQDYT